MHILLPECVCVCVGALLTSKMVCGDCLLVGALKTSTEQIQNLSSRCIVLLTMPMSVCVRVLDIARVLVSLLYLREMCVWLMSALRMPTQEFQNFSQ